MATNLKVPFFLSQSIANRMVEDGRHGKIINVASLMSFQGGAAVFLASRAADYVHGTLIPVDGGWLAR